MILVRLTVIIVLSDWDCCLLHHHCKDSAATFITDVLSPPLVPLSLQVTPQSAQSLAGDPPCAIVSGRLWSDALVAYAQLA